MKTQTHRPLEFDQEPRYGSHLSDLDLESISDDELEAMVFQEEEESPRGFLNLPTMAGLSLIVVGVAYLFQELGIWNGWDVSILVEMLPWLAGILIILLGFGVLSWRPKSRKKVKKGIEVPSGKQKVVVEATGKKRKRLTKSRNKKVAGVAAGIAEHFNIDPTLVRIALVIGTVATQGSLLLAYLVLAYVMPQPDAPALEERITIVRDR